MQTTCRLAPSGTPGRADQRREPGRINEADLVKVDYQRAAAGCQLEKALAQPGYGGNVNFPGYSHDRIAPVAPNPRMVSASPIASLLPANPFTTTQSDRILLQLARVNGELKLR